MTKQEIIDAFDVAQRLRQLEELVPEACTHGLDCMVEASSTIICEVFDDDESIGIVLQALRTSADPGQLRELAEENGRLKRELEAAQTRLEATQTQHRVLEEERTYYKEQLRAKEDELAYYKKQTLAAFAAVDDVPEDSTEGEIDAEEAPAAPAKKPRKATPRHTWTTAEDAWIAEHLNSARSSEVAERFGVCKALPRIKRHVQEFLMREELSGRLEYGEVNKNEEEPDSDRHGGHEPGGLAAREKEQHRRI